MKLAILSRAPHAYSTQRLRSAAENRGHTVKVLNTLRFAIDLSGEEPDLQYRGRLLSDYDAILPRIGNSITYYGTAVVRQFEQMDVYTPNTANGITNSRDKLRATQILSRHNIGMPRDGVREQPRRRADGDRAGGRRAGRHQAARGHAGHRRHPGARGEDRGGDHRDAALDEAERPHPELHRREPRDATSAPSSSATGSWRRCAGWRAATSSGRTCTAAAPSRRSTLTPEFEEAAVRSAQIMGLRVAGVDMLEGNDGPLVMEVNSSPGLEGIERATGLDVAGAIIDFIDNQVAFPEIDVRQRLSVSTGYGVAELLVHTNADLVGKSIARLRASATATSPC